MKIAKRIFSLLLLFTLYGCYAKQTHNTFTDRSGREVTLLKPPDRIVSAAPSNTEIITDLGRADRLIAVDRHSVNIEGIPAGLPLLDFFYPDAEFLITLEPDLIIANGHNPTGSGEDPFRLLREAGIPVVYIPMSRSIDDIYRDIAFIADLLQVREKGEEVITAMKLQIASITQKTAKAAITRTVYFEISAAPQMMTFGKDSYIGDMISAINAENIFENDGWLVSPGFESIIERNPDIILTTVNYLEDPVGEIKSRPGFNHINAVINNRIFRIDTDSSVRPSARIIKALDQMAEAVYTGTEYGDL